ncbi:DUF305 domain-containing protein [Bradyrhizobium sp. WYCCWR 13023]|uniref:DUF305 domain-containing protein n=1 Tax=Bradyrhizobium zhengyangense TaxID=2911009 RepID=A0A9X1U876_9BRAD|nr:MULTISPECIES: DUF305 domain-containing protein [Bradyrhizobium]MCG2628755.1 DUF305 domain-containing protein [Bradyrhizobium zhengyangense]MCG2644332.1 DUF305 domain-containing protein [Bradyrhizobium zhengyangense]MCG2668408.1 DUF305 domain-containing protein [Bradyrhizobium zhengyangense]
MHPSPFHRVAAALASRCRWPRPGLGTTLFAARILVAFAVPPLVFAHEAHPAAPQAALSAEESAFLQENDAAMTKMMNDMAAKPTGDIDRDFVAMMNPHHQGAIDMAVIELRYGKNEQLRRIAQEIIVDQMQEIAAMKLAIGEPATDTTPAPTQSQSVPVADVHHHPSMQMDMSAGMKK